MTDWRARVIVPGMEYRVRSLEEVCLRDLSSFPVLTLTGPRQSGKSTLLKRILPDWKYVNLEDLSSREFALQDPVGFLKTYDRQVVFDEIQRAPLLLSQIQTVVDEDRTPGRFALTGSHNLLLLEQVSQSLAGRTSVRQLFPFSHRELSADPMLGLTVEDSLFYGGYPVVHSEPKVGKDWLDSYIQTYVERDVRLIRNVSSLTNFSRFLRVCAARCSQLLDLSSVGNDLGITHNTVNDWLGILEAGFLCFRLEPYFKNYSKRLIKRPKLYFYDTGLLCRLLNISEPEALLTHPMRGAIFENWCVSEAQKAFSHQGLRSAIWFWRDRKIEVDLLVEAPNNRLLAFECKSGRTTQSEFIEAALALREIVSDQKIVPGVVYGGEESQNRSGGTFYSWNDYGLSISSLVSEAV